MIALTTVASKDRKEQFVNINLDAGTQTGSKLLQLSVYARFYMLPPIE
jgi:hypothetical protein